MRINGVGVGRFGRFDNTEGWLMYGGEILAAGRLAFSLEVMDSNGQDEKLLLMLKPFDAFGTSTSFAPGGIANDGKESIDVRTDISKGY